MSTQVGAIYYDASIRTGDFKKNANELKGAAEDTGKSMSRSFEDSVKRMQPTFKRMAVLGTAALAGIALGVRQSIKAFQEQERAEARLEQISRQVTGANDDQIRSFKELATQLQAVGVVGDEVIIAGQSQLASFSKMPGTVSTLTTSMADLAVATYGVNVSQEQAIQSANMIGKALSGQLGAMTRAGVLVSDEYRAAFEAANDEQERAAIIANIIADNYGGLNKSMRKTSEGGIQAAKNSFSDLMETLGEQFIPIVESVVQSVTPIIEKIQTWIKENPELTRNIIIVSAAVAALIAGVGFLGMLILPLIAGVKALAAVFAVIFSPIGLVVAAIVGLVAAFIYAYKTNEEFRDKVNTAFNSIKESVTTILQSVVEFIKSAIEVAKQIWQDWGDVILAYAQGVWSAISSVIEGVLQVITGIFDVFAGIFSGDWSRVWNGIKSIFSGVWNIIVGIFKQVWNNIRTAFTVAFRLLKSSISNSFNQTVSFFRLLPGRILGALGSLGSLLFNAGKSILTGLTNGIKSMASAPVTAIRNVVSSIRNLLPFSPAKEGPFSGRGWVTYSGESIAQGLASGLIKGAGVAVAATEQMVGAMSGGLPTMAMDAIGSGGTTVENNIGTINIASEVDGESWLKRLSQDELITQKGMTRG